MARAWAEWALKCLPTQMGFCDSLKGFLLCKFFYLYVWIVCFSHLNRCTILLMEPWFSLWKDIRTPCTAWLMPKMVNWGTVSLLCGVHLSHLWLPSENGEMGLLSVSAWECWGSVLYQVLGFVVQRRVWAAVQVLRSPVSQRAGVPLPLSLTSALGLALCIVMGSLRRRLTPEIPVFLLICLSVLFL